MFGNTNTTSSGFSFGTPSGGQPVGGAGGFAFGTNTGANTGTATTLGFEGFNLGGTGGLSAASTTAQPGEFHFGGVKTSTAGFGAFSFGGSTQAAQTTTAGGFSFGATTSSIGGGVGTGLGGVGTGISSASTGLGGVGTSTGFGGTGFGSTSGIGSLGGSGIGGLGGTGGGSLTLGIPSTTAPIFGSLKTGTPVNIPASSSTGFAGFGTLTTATTKTSSGSLLGSLLTSTTTAAPVPASTTTSAAPSVGFSFGPTTSSTAPVSGFSFGNAAATTTASSAGGFGFGTTTTTAPTVVTTASQGGFLTGSTSQAATSAPSLGGGIFTSTSTSSTALTTTSTSQPGTNLPGPKQMTFRQLEETINKWTTELEDQEKYFLDQATQVNAWDRIVMENGEKIVQLNKDVEKVKLDQQKLDHELDFIQSQQKELEDILAPLEKALDSTPAISYQQHADIEREQTYLLTESLDVQLKRMGHDLKEIIERLNSNNPNPDSTDPVQQITKILNAHVISLMWVDRNTANLQKRIEEISKQMDIDKREQERHLRLAYS